MVRSCRAPQAAPGRLRSYRACSSPFFFKLIAIKRQVIFSIRSWLAICVLTLLTIFHIWVPSGSFFCISSG